MLSFCANTPVTHTAVDIKKFFELISPIENRTIEVISITANAAIII